jgi:hypothetical protein
MHNPPCPSVRVTANPVNVSSSGPARFSSFGCGYRSAAFSCQISTIAPATASPFSVSTRPNTYRIVPFAWPPSVSA